MRTYKNRSRTTCYHPSLLTLEVRSLPGGAGMMFNQSLLASPPDPSLSDSALTAPLPASSLGSSVQVLQRFPDHADATAASAPPVSTRWGDREECQTSLANDQCPPEPNDQTDDVGYTYPGGSGSLDNMWISFAISTTSEGPPQSTERGGPGVPDFYLIGAVVVGGSSASSLHVDLQPFDPAHDHPDVTVTAFLDGGWGSVFEANGMRYQLGQATLHQDHGNPNAPWVLDISINGGALNLAIVLNGVGLSSDGGGFKAHFDGVAVADATVGNITQTLFQE